MFGNNSISDAVHISRFREREQSLPGSWFVVDLEISISLVLKYVYFLFSAQWLIAYTDDDKGAPNRASPEM